MKVKKVIMRIFLVWVMVGWSTGSAFSADDDSWFKCTIVRVGGYSTSESSPMYVMLSDTGSPQEFTNKNFRIPEGRLNQIMAVLLTAASIDAKVRILGNPNISKDQDRLLKAAFLLP